MCWIRDSTAPERTGSGVSLGQNCVRTHWIRDFIAFYTIFKPGDHNAVTLDTLDTLIDQVIAWSTALAPLRTASPAAACG